MSKKVFVFGIGGTGARVLRALTMELASGMELDPSVDKIIPIIIDVDSKNADTLRCIEAMKLYKSIRDKACHKKGGGGFFAPEFVTLGSERPAESDGQRIKESFQLNFKGITKTFYEYLNLDSVSVNSMQFMHSLFDNSSDPRDSNKEIHLDLEKGFRGNPNLGAIIFNDLVNTEEFRFFEKCFSENDRVIIISSIFGGTGSSGLPQVIRNLRNSSNGYLAEAAISAVVVQPYFSVAHDPSSPINSDIFIEKTKAALNYYNKEINDKLNRIYYVADRPGSPYKNDEGGEGQMNDAHLVEMISAYGCVHFMNAHDEDLEKSDLECFAFGVKGEQNPMTFSHFFESSQRDLFTPMVLMTYFSKLFNEHLPANLQMNFAKGMGLDTGGALKNNRFFVQLGKFLNNHFLPFLQEMSRNQSRKFSPFNFDISDSKFAFDDLILGREVTKKGGVLFKSRKAQMTTNYFNMSLNKVETSLKSSGVDNMEERFMKTLYQVCQETFNTFIAELPI